MEQSPCCAHLGQKSSVSNQPRDIKLLGDRVVPIGLKISLSRFRQALSRAFSLSKEPAISEQKDRQGNAYYRVYDPVEDIHHIFTSEEAVRIWLEEHHYRQ